jgi:cytochrome subunit of sulfide dehydrogenase
MNLHERLLTMALVLGLSSASAQAQVGQAGRLLASNCFQCHGTNGRGPGFETLAGKSSKSIVEELQEMRAGKEGAGIMPRHAMGYTDAQLQQLATWLSLQSTR